MSSHRQPAQAPLALKPTPYGMPVYSWLCRTELDRERMVATVRWVGPARATMFLILLGVLVGSAHHTGWLPLIPLFVSAAVSIPLYRNLERRKRPEFWAA